MRPSSMPTAMFMRMVREVVEPPFAEMIPLDHGPLRGKSPLSLLWRKLRPGVALWRYGQRALQCEVIEANHQRILWIYKGVPQVGDALMDLSSRVLLKERGITLDLYTDSHLHRLFQADDVFARVFSDAADARPDGYDLVMLDSFKWRCIEEKVRHFRRVPFATMRGYFSGPEFNRTLFSFFRMNQLLRIGVPSAEVQCSAVPHLCAAPADRECVEKLEIAAGAVAFALGGASPGRTYLHWDKVIRDLLHKKHLPQIVLLGSSNAVSMRDKIVETVKPYGVQVIDCVDRYTLTQTFAIVGKCRMAACADGGLLHIANAAQVQTVSLFDRHVSPDMRLTAANHSLAQQSSGQISDIPQAKVVEAIAAALSRAQSKQG